jgi:hypothetical protein
MNWLIYWLLWGETKSLNCHWRTYCSSPRSYELESDGGMILTGENQRTRRRTCPSATMSTTNPTWIDPCANPGFRGDRPATNLLSQWRGQLTDHFLCPLLYSQFIALKVGTVSFQSAKLYFEVARISNLIGRHSMCWGAERCRIGSDDRLILFTTFCIYVHV